MSLKPIHRFYLFVGLFPTLILLIDPSIDPPIVTFQQHLTTDCQSADVQVASNMPKPSFSEARNKARITEGPRPVILWFRQDLRLTDQPALVAACKSSCVVPVYILDDETPGNRAMGGASRWWLHHSLKSLEKSLESLGSKLILRQGRSSEVLSAIMNETNASAIHAIRHYEPWWIKAEREVQKNCDLVLHDGNQLCPPGSVLNGSGKLFKVYTPFWRALLRQMPPEKPVEKPEIKSLPTDLPESDSLDSWKLLPQNPNWAQEFGEWTPGEPGAAERLEVFAKKVADYEDFRNFPSKDATSRLSPHLHFGEISPRQIWFKVADKSSSVHSYLNELGWRDYAQNILLLEPEIGEENAKDQYNKLPWRYGEQAESDLNAWQRGETGYPIVDAGMRQLWRTGWMHNRVRMIAASFLIKHLLIDWRRGEQWFWDTLVDADYGSNACGWQWVAGSGVDSQMWSRVMAPVTQSSKFEAAEYIRQWVPELEALSDKEIHDPDAAEVKPDNYPRMIVAHKEGRERALEAYEHIRKRE